MASSTSRYRLEGIILTKPYGLRARESDNKHITAINRPSRLPVHGKIYRHLESVNVGHVRGDQYQPSDVDINRLISGADEK